MTKNIFGRPTVHVCDLFFDLISMAFAYLIEHLSSPSALNVKICLNSLKLSDNHIISKMLQVPAYKEFN